MFCAGYDFLSFSILLLSLTRLVVLEGTHNKRRISQSLIRSCYIQQPVLFLLRVISFAIMDQLKTLESEIATMRAELARKEQQHSSLTLTNQDIARYSRQIILPEIRVGGQKTLKSSSVLIVGAGGLGCPCAMYLAAAGVGRIGIVDYDDVEINNLHRQVLHKEKSIGISKVESIRRSIKELNKQVHVETHHLQLDSRNATGIVEKYDVIIDCSDNVATRYLINDCCVLNRKPLVSGSAIKWEGQLTVYNYAQGPCYRCIFPKPPPPEAVLNCGDGGVLGAVTGTIGSLQALEGIKILLGNTEGTLSGRLLLFDGLSSTIRNVKLRDRREDCDVCSKTPKITALIDYEAFCRMAATDKTGQVNLLTPQERISVQQLKQIIDQHIPHTLIDVRSESEFEICQLPNSLHISMENVMNNHGVHNLESQDPIFVVCRRGNDSQKAVRHLKGLLKGIEIKDVIGGLHAWTKEIDSEFPIY